MSREYTRKLLDMVDSGMIDARQVLRDALNHMSEDEVKDMAETNGYVEEEDEEDLDEDEEDAAKHVR